MENTRNNDLSGASEIRQQFESAGQGQVFLHWDELSPEARADLVSQAREIDLGEVNQLIETHLQSGRGESADFSSLEPPEYLPFPEQGQVDPRWESAREAGEEALRSGRVAAFTVAGGQGTRLGFDGPKGTFPVTPIRSKTLFQVLGEKILAARKAYGCSIPWLIMTSHANHAETVAFFQKQNFFGFDEKDVIFFRQGRMPAVDKDGRILLEGKGTIAMSPDGHGGSLRALCRSGATGTLRERGIDVISYFQVDNPLVKPVDPAFIGFHVQAGSEMSSKMIPKSDAGEKVGVFAQREGRMEVIEYSDLPADLAEEKDADGKLRFRCGSIAVHILSLPFVERVGGESGESELPFHRASKKIQAIDESGNPVNPAEPNGVKFEMFVFDALPFAKNPVVVEARRDDEFSPVKNAEGRDSPQTCREAQLRQFARWLKAAGVDLKTDEDGLPNVEIEISPLFASDEASFVDAWNRLSEKPEIRQGLVLE